MLGEMALEAGDAAAAIEQWLAIEGQDVHYLALAARLLLAAYDKLGRGAEGDAVLQRLLRQYPDLDVVDVVYERLQAREGVEAAHTFARYRLREHPTMPGLKKYSKHTCWLRRPRKT